MRTVGDITLVYSDDADWFGIYVDGELRHQGPNVNTRVLLTALHLPYTRYFDLFGTHLPDKLRDLGLD